jgi:hypothetical protein
MTNPQLLDFIRRQLQQGITKEKISSDLLANNWTQQDIEEGFAAVNNFPNSIPVNNFVPTFNNLNTSTTSLQTNNHSSKKGLWTTIAVLFIIAIGASGYYFRNNLPIIKDLIKSDSTIVEQNKKLSDQTPKVETLQQPQNQQEQVSTTQQPTQVNGDTAQGNNGVVTTVKNTEVENKTSDSSLTTDIKVKTDVTTTVDCGTADCFSKKFIACQPATLSADSGGLGAVSYKIIGPVSNGCSLTFKYTKNPNPDWVNKEMTCPFDNKVSLDDSVKKVFDGVFSGSVICTGPLYSTLRAMVSN